MKYLKLLPAAAMLLTGLAVLADYNPADPPEPGPPVVEETTYSLSVSSLPTEGGWVSGASGQYKRGTSLTVHASANTSFRFAGWTDESGEVLSTSTSYTFTMPGKDYRLYARFLYDPSSPSEPPVPIVATTVYTDNQPAEGGRISLSNNGPYTVGQTVTFYAYPNTGFSFSGWSVNGEMLETTSTTYTRTLTKGTQRIVAHYTYSPGNPAEPGVPHLTHTLTLLKDKDGGTVSGGGAVVEGQYARVSTSLNDWYSFEGWTNEEGDTISRARTFDYLMPDRDVTLTAHYSYNYNPASPAEPGQPVTGPTTSTVVAPDQVVRPRCIMQDVDHVAILCETEGATIRYTLNGTDPTETAGTLYTGPVYVPTNVEVRAVAYNGVLKTSPVTIYHVESHKAGAPTFDCKVRKLEMKSSTPGADIYYTLDFGEPNLESPKYTGPLTLDEDCRIKAYAVKEGLADSDVSIFAWRASDFTVKTPTYRPNEKGRLEIRSLTSAATIHYTLDDTEPTGGTAKVYSAPLICDGTEIIRAYGTYEDYFDSEVSRFETANFMSQAPWMELVNDSVVISVRERMPMRILYTLDETEPSFERLVSNPTSVFEYVRPIAVEEGKTVKAVALEDGMLLSPVTTFVNGYKQWQEPLLSFRNDKVWAEHEEGTKVIYTLDGTVPDPESESSYAEYDETNGISLTSGCTVTALTVGEPRKPSEPAKLTVQQLSAPEWSKSKLTLIAGWDKENEADSEVYYTVDGSDPKGADAKPYSSALTLTQEDHVYRAVVKSPSKLTSPVAEYKFVAADWTLSTPTFSPDYLHGMVEVSAAHVNSDGYALKLTTNEEAETARINYTPKEGAAEVLSTQVSFRDAASGKYAGGFQWIEALTEDPSGEHFSSAKARFGIEIAPAPELSFSEDKVWENRYSEEDYSTSAVTTLYTVGAESVLPSVETGDAGVQSYDPAEGVGLSNASVVTALSLRDGLFVSEPTSITVEQMEAPVLTKEKLTLVADWNLEENPESYVRYTSDGTMPGLKSGLRYESPIELTQTDLNYRAVACSPDKLTSVPSEVYEFIARDWTLSTPTFEPRYLQGALEVNTTHEKADGYTLNINVNDGSDDSRIARGEMTDTDRLSALLSFRDNETGLYAPGLSRFEAWTSDPEGEYFDSGTAAYDIKIADEPELTFRADRVWEAGYSEQDYAAGLVNTVYTVADAPEVPSLTDLSTLSSYEHQEGIGLNRACIVTALSILNDLYPSEPASIRVEQMERPVLSKERLTLVADWEQSEELQSYLRFTDDGSEPGLESGMLYDGPIELVQADRLYQAVACSPYMLTSVPSEPYEFVAADWTLREPVFEPDYERGTLTARYDPSINTDRAEVIIEANPGADEEEISYDRNAEDNSVTADFRYNFYGTYPEGLTSFTALTVDPAEEYFPSEPVTFEVRIHEPPTVEYDGRYLRVRGEYAEVFHLYMGGDVVTPDETLPTMEGSFMEEGISFRHFGDMLIASSGNDRFVSPPTEIRLQSYSNEELVISPYGVLQLDWIRSGMIPSQEITIKGTFSWMDMWVMAEIWPEVTVLNAKGASFPQEVSLVDWKNLRFMELPENAARADEVGYMGRLLTSAPRLREVRWSTNAPLLLDVPASLFIWSDHAGTVSRGFNVAEYNDRWECRNFRLTDDDLNPLPFSARYDFRAESAEYVREFWQETPSPVAGGCQGWESIMLPFAPDRIVEQRTRQELSPLTASSWGAKWFWLYQADSKDYWLAAQAIEANRPYLLSMPNHHHYDDNVVVTGPVSFIGSDVEIGSTWEGDYGPTQRWYDSWQEINRHFEGFYEEPEEREDLYVLNNRPEIGPDPENQVATVPYGSMFLRDYCVPQPYTAAVRHWTDSRRAIPVFGEGSGLTLPDMYGDIQLEVIGNRIHVSAPFDCELPLLTPGGLRLETLRLSGDGAGNLRTAVSNPLQPGLYIIAGRKIRL